MATQQQHKAPETPETQIDVTAAEWLLIIITGFTGVFAGPFAIIPGAILLGMFTYRVNPELMRNTAAGKFVRGLLPAPAPDDSSLPAPATTGHTATAQTAARVASATAAPATAAPALAMIDLATLARCTTILLVGSRGSGKSTLLRAILATKAVQKEELIAMYDPHAHPQAWPMASLLHNTEEKISSGLVSAYKRLRARKKEMNEGIRIEGWPRFTLAADEWGSIISNVELPESIKKTPGEVSTELMKEGRKFGIGFVAGAHGFTNKSLGCTGDQDAFMQSFDWIVNMGGFMRKALPKEQSHLWESIPLGTNEQGGTFPLIVLCENPTTGEFRLLDMRGLDKRVDTQPAPAPAAMPWEQAKPSADSALLAGMLGSSDDDKGHVKSDSAISPFDSKVTAAQSEVTQGDMVTVTMPTPAEMIHITMSLSQGIAPSQVAKSMKGHNGRTHEAYMAKVKYVKQLIDAQGSASEGDASDGSEDA